MKPAFHAKGSVTAGNSSQTSDGAAATVVMSSDKARQLGIKPYGAICGLCHGGLSAGRNGPGAGYAIPKVLKMAGLKLEDIDVFELNEAFAAQALSVIKEAGLDPNKINPNGGAVALGHPLGCTGAS